MSTVVHLPGGGKLSVPTDDPAVASAAARKYLANQKGGRPSTAAPHPAAGIVRAAIGNIVDNILPNWGDEVAGAGAWIGAKLGTGHHNPDTAFQDGQREFQEEQAAYKSEHPTLSKATAAAGFGLGLAAPVGRIAQGAGRLARMAHGAAVGAGYGAVSGAGEGDTMADRGANALRSGAIGGAMGAAATPLIAGASRAGRALRHNIPGMDGAARRLANVPRAVMRRPLVPKGQRAVEQADRMIGQRMNQGNIQAGMGQPGPAASPEAIGTELERRQGLGVPAMIGDVTEPLREVTSWASRGKGPGQTMVRQRLDDRKLLEASRVRQHIVSEMGPAVDPLAQAEQMAARSRAQAEPGYRAAYAEPMVVTPEIEEIMQTPAFRKALPQAVENIQNAKRNPSSLGFRLDPDGNIAGVDTLSTEGFDQVIRSMRDSGRAAAEINPVTGRVTNTSNSFNINARAGELRDHLASQNDAYAEVTQRYADDAAQREALMRGGGVRNLTGSEVGAQFRQTPAPAREFWSLGARSALADDASQFGAKHPTGDTAARIRSYLGDDAKQEAIGQMTGNTGAVRGLQERLEAEHQGNILWKEVHGNSKTASRQALDTDIDREAGTISVSNLTGPGMLRKVIDVIAAKSTAQARQDVKARIAQIATETNPATVKDLMAAIANRAEKDREFAGFLHRSGLLGTRAYGAGIEPTRPVGHGMDEESDPAGGAWEDDTFLDDPALGLNEVR